MSEVIVFKGAVSFPITLDPSVWIFDDRKFDLGTYTGEEDNDTGNQKKYLEGAKLPNGTRSFGKVQPCRRSERA